MTKAGLSCLKHLSLRLHRLTGISFKVSLKVAAQMNPLSSEHSCDGAKQNYIILPQIIKTVDVHSNYESNRCKYYVHFWASVMTGF